MATHFSVLAWKIPGTEEPGGLQSTGSRRIEHDLVTKQEVSERQRRAEQHPKTCEKKGDPKLNGKGREHLMEAGKTSVAWSFNATPNVDTWRADVVTPLTAYTHGDGSWDDVVSAFVDGWATEYALANGQ